MNPTRTLPGWLTTLITSPPPAGQGVNLWFYRIARHLHAHMPAPEIVALLLEYTAHCGRPVTRVEVERAVANSLPHAWQPRGPSAGFAAPAARKWPEPDLARIEAIAQTGGLADLWEASPVRIEDSDCHTEAVIDALFPGNPLLCCGKTQSKFDTRPREAWRGELAGLQFIVPSPMSAMTGLTHDGRQSKHALSNTSARRFLVVEFDSGTVHEQAALLLHLAGFAPMVCALHSGGKSLHAWFFAHGQPDEKALKFFRYAVSLGADPATWARSQFVRMPDGLRENGRRQTAYYFAPHRATT